MEVEDEAVKFNLSFKLLLGISILVLVSIAVVLFLHCRRGRQRRETDDQQGAGSCETNKNKGLDPLAIASLPKFKHKQSVNLVASECSVCLCAIAEDVTIRVLPNCKHVFHVDCIDAWLNSSTSCPVCRTMVEPKMVLTDHVTTTSSGTESQPHS